MRATSSGSSVEYSVCRGKEGWEEEERPQFFMGWCGSKQCHLSPPGCSHISFSSHARTHILYPGRASLIRSAGGEAAEPISAGGAGSIGAVGEGGTEQ